VYCVGYFTNLNWDTQSKYSAKL